MQVINITIIGEDRLLLPGVQLSEMNIDRDVFKCSNAFKHNYKFIPNNNKTETTLEITGIIPDESTQKTLHLYSLSEQPLQLEIAFSEEYKVNGECFITSFQLIDNGKFLPKFNIIMQLYNIIIG